MKMNIIKMKNEITASYIFASLLASYHLDIQKWPYTRLVTRLSTPKCAHNMFTGMIKAAN